MRIFWSLVGVVLIFAGTVWMTGQIQWAVYGGISSLVGLGLLLLANHKKTISTKR
jgi:hypothetical protein